MKIYIDEEVNAVRDLFSDIQPTVYVRETVLRYLAALEAGYRDRHPAVGTILRNYSPRHLSSAANSNELPAVTPETLQDIAAHYFGFAQFAALSAEATLDATFENAVDALLNGHIAQLEDMLNQKPALVQSQSAYGHRAGLLHYLAANGVELHRQVVPANAPELLQLLLSKGADPDQAHQIYGGRHSLRDLIETSAHPANAGVREGLLAQLD